MWHEVMLLIHLRTSLKRCVRASHGYEIQSVMRNPIVRFLLIVPFYTQILTIAIPLVG
jgi:hypothetical protein